MPATIPAPALSDASLQAPTVDVEGKCRCSLVNTSAALVMLLTVSKRNSNSLKTQEECSSYAL